MSTLKLTGSSSGSTSLQAPASGSDRTITFPNNAGTVLTNATTGCILQVKQNTTTSATGYFDLGTADNWYDYTNMNVAITPASTSNKILISVHAMGEGNYADHGFHWRIKRAVAGGSTTYIQGGADGNRITVIGQIAIGYYSVNNLSTPSTIHLSNYLDSPSATTEVTYTVQMSVNSSSKKWYYNRSVTDSDTSSYERGVSHITVMEVAG